VSTWGEILKELQDAQAQAQVQALPAGVSVLDLVRRKYLAALHQHTSRSVILYATRWTQGNVIDPQSISITAEDVHGLMEVVHGLPGGALDLVLHSPGGSPEATDAIVKYLRSKFNDIRVIVPHAAMSAATMLACAADRIVMGRHSFLGPIDPQLIIHHGELGLMSVPAYAILEQFELAQKQCQQPGKLASWVPILRQYGPALLIQCQLAIQLAESLVKDWLTTYMLKATPAAAAKAANTLSGHGNFKSHGRFIGRDEARSFGLVIDDLESDQSLQDAVLSVFHATTHTFSAAPATKIIENHLGKAFVKQQQQQVIVLGQGGRPPQGFQFAPP
jgi:hypothetical protein